jgi:MSHA biogenesis protein MshJ
MNLGATYTNLASRFNAMSLRERALLAAAFLGLIVLVWDQALMSPLRLKKQRLTQDIGEVKTSLQTLTDTIEGRARDNPLSQAMEQKQALTSAIAAVDGQLQSASAGLIAPQRMLSVLQDVLKSQQGLRLVSMRNLPVTSLAQPIASNSASSTDKSAAPPPSSGPYVHSMELEIEGSYLDVLQYLKSIEGLQWRFYWQVLELKTTEYPVNHVRIRLNTLSMDREWLGV